MLIMQHSTSCSSQISSGLMLAALNKKYLFIASGSAISYFTNMYNILNFNHKISKNHPELPLKWWNFLTGINALEFSSLKIMNPIVILFNWLFNQQILLLHFLLLQSWLLLEIILPLSDKLLTPAFFLSRSVNISHTYV